MGNLCYQKFNYPLETIYFYKNLYNYGMKDISNIINIQISSQLKKTKLIIELNF